MRTPHFHMPHIAWPHLSRPGSMSRARAGSGRSRLPKLLSGADLLAVVLALTLAAAVGAVVTLWVQS